MTSPWNLHTVNSVRRFMMKLSTATARNVNSTTSSVVPLVIGYTVHVVGFAVSTALHLTKAADFRSGGFTSQSQLGPHALQWRQSHSAWMECIAGGEVCLPAPHTVTLTVLTLTVIQPLASYAEIALLQQCTLPICMYHADKFCMQPVLHASVPESVISLC